MGEKIVLIKYSGNCNIGNFLFTCLSAKVTNKVEFNIIKFHEFIYRNWEIGGFKYVGVQDRALKLNHVRIPPAV